MTLSDVAWVHLQDDVTFVPVSHMFPASGFPNTMSNLDNSFDNLFSSNMAVNTQTFGGRGDVGMPGSMFDSVPGAYTGMQATTYTGREVFYSYFYLKRINVCVLQCAP